MDQGPVKIVFIVGGGRFFGAELPLGGAASYLKAVARALPRERFDLLFIFLFSGPTVDEFEGLGFRCQVLDKAFRGDPFLPLRIARVLRAEKPNLVVTAVSNANFYGRLGARLAGVRRLATVVMDYMQGIMAGERAKPLLERFGYWQEKALWRLNSWIVAPSNPLRDHIIRRWGVPADRVLFIPGVVDTDQPAPDRARIDAARKALDARDGQLLIGAMCRLAPVKNLPMMLRVAHRVDETVPGGIRLVIAGEGPQRRNLETLAHELGLQDVVRFVGWWNDSAAFSSAVDLHLLTSYTESQGISLLEAMAASKPVIATAVGGVVEVVEDGVTGLLVEPDNDEAMARCVVELLRDRELAERMGRAGRRRVETLFSPAQVREGFETLL